MTIIRPKKSREARVNPVLLLGVCCMIALAAANVVAYDRIVGVTRSITTEKKSFEDMHEKNVDLKNKWYQALDRDNMKAFVEEYGFVKVSSPGYLPS